MISQDLNPVLNWLKTCPFKYNISTLQTGHLHVKIEVPVDAPTDHYKKEEAEDAH